MRNSTVASLIVILGAHALGIAYDWYFLLPWFDIPMHIAGGMWVALLFLYLFDMRWQDLPTAWWKKAIFTLGAVALVGVLWEFYEYLYDVFLAGSKVLFEEQSLGLFDTLHDLFNDLLGGAIVLTGYAIVRSVRNRSRRSKSSG